MSPKEKNWLEGQGSNLRISESKSDVLPLDYLPKLVGVKGFEPSPLMYPKHARYQTAPHPDGARHWIRTSTKLISQDFESCASANSATLAYFFICLSIMILHTIIFVKSRLQIYMCKKFETED